MQITLRAAFVVAGLVWLAAPTHAEYFPLDEGVLWHYEVRLQGNAATDIRYFQGTTEVGGTTAQVLHRSGGFDDGLRQFWSRDANGDILFHGFDRPGASVIYSPPILWLDEPFFIGKTWTTSVQSPFQVELEFEVVAEGALTVPAGTFQCFTIELRPILLFGKMSGFDVLGHRRVAAAGDPRDLWSYADGTGLVQWALGETRTDHLLAIEHDQVAVTPATWSSIRQLYRGPAH